MQAPNNALERTVTRHHVCAASTTMHYSLAARMMRDRAAAQCEF
jgi:hypothetical protein